MAYASSSDVAALCSDLLGPEHNFSESSCPSLDEVNSFLSSGCGIIESHLGTWGYSTPVASGTGLYDWLTNLNSLWGAAYANFQRITATVRPGERTRGQVYEQMFWSNLEKLGTMDLTALGGVSVDTSRGGTIFVGGISVDSKQSYDDDSDRVKPRFNRDQFGFPGTTKPAPITSSS